MSQFEEGSCFLIGQWANLEEDLLKFLPRQLNFKRPIKKKARVMKALKAN